MKWSKKICIEFITAMKDPFETALNAPIDGAPASPDEVLAQLLAKAKEETK